MSQSDVRQLGDHLSSLDRPRMVHLVKGGMEAILLLMIMASPWVYGAVHPGFELLLDVGIGLLLALWGGRMLLEGQFTWQKCPVAIFLAGLFLLGTWQTTSLSRPVLEWMSPATARLYQQLLPIDSEVLPDGTKVTSPAGHTVSVNPGATRKQTLRLLAVFLVFAVVRNNLVSALALRRLCVVCLINGLFLAVFAFVQSATSPRNMLYWTYPSLGNVFGPFVNRNHYPFYVNVCIGLAAGLLLSRNKTQHASRREAAEGWLAWPARILQDPVSLWISAALALMIASVALSLSRGGLLALLGGLGTCLLLNRLTSAGPRRRAFGLLVGAAAVVLIGGMSVGLAGWFGYGPIKERLRTIWEGEAFTGRFPVWMRVFPLAGQFPIWGTGYGTVELTEPLTRQLTEGGVGDDDIVWQHVENEYLEILLEGGVIGLALSLLCVGLVYRLGYRAMQSHKRSGLVLGALFGFTTVVIHSIGDFGVHIPAIALLATVVCAQLAGLGSRERESVAGTSSRTTMETDGPNYSFRLGGLAPLLGAIICLALGGLLCADAWKAHRVARLRMFADRLAQPSRVGFLDRAASLDPEDAELLFEVAHVRMAIYEKAQDEQTKLDLLLPALHDYLRARNACPMLPYSHLALAANRDRFLKSDSRADYLHRAQLLAPCNAELWYLSGVQELAAHERARAGTCWRRCLELSDYYLPEILARTGPSFDTDALIKMVLPDRSDILLAAATRLYPDDEEKRGPFLQHALDLLANQPAPLTGKDLHDKARILRSAGQFDIAVETYEILLTQHPDESTWRFEFARFLYDQGRLLETRVQLLILLTQKQHGPARDLLRIVERELNPRG